MKTGHLTHLAAGFLQRASVALAARYVQQGGNGSVRKHTCLTATGLANVIVGKVSVWGSDLTAPPPCA